jgi:hypothetical protein
MYVHGGLAAIGHDLVFFVYGKARRPQFRHELFHLMANTAWGTTDSRLLNEGTAVYADNECYVANPLYALAAYALRNHQALPLKSLIDDFDGEARQHEVRTYLQSAALCKYLYEKYGIEKFRLLWVGGFGQFEAIYGLPVSQLEQDWATFVQTIPPPEQLDWEKLMQNGCG